MFELPSIMVHVPLLSEGRYLREVTRGVLVQSRGVRNGGHYMVVHHIFVHRVAPLQLANSRIRFLSNAALYS